MRSDSFDLIVVACFGRAATSEDSDRLTDRHDKNAERDQLLR